MATAVSITHRSRASAHELLSDLSFRSVEPVERSKSCARAPGINEQIGRPSEGRLVRRGAAWIAVSLSFRR
jgi:hypothetical protein